MQDRYRTIAGDAFTVEYGSGYDVVLVTNFLHHFDAPTNTIMLKKVHAALKPGGRVAMLKFVPNPDRVSPPMPARFSLTMLAATAGGDAFTFAELRGQLAVAREHRFGIVSLNAGDQSFLHFRFGAGRRLARCLKFGYKGDLSHSRGRSRRCIRGGATPNHLAPAGRFASETR